MDKVRMPRMVGGGILMLDLVTAALANHLAGPGGQGGEQRRGAVAQVIMGAPFHLSRPHGQ